jgi:hypothetical protein
MLGIAIIVLLGFFLYHYRPRSLETKFKQSLRWSEFAKACFVCHPIFVLTILCSSIILSFLFGKLDPVFWTQSENMLLYPFENLRIESMPFISVFVVPVISAWLTQKKIIEPLGKENIPGHNLFHLIGLLSITPLLWYLFIIYFGYIVGGIISIFGYEILLQTLMNTISYFSILLIGMGAVEISRYKAMHTGEIAISA